jgi:cytochrome c553
MAKGNWAVKSWLGILSVLWLAFLAAAVVYIIFAATAPEEAVAEEPAVGVVAEEPEEEPDVEEEPEEEPEVEEEPDVEEEPEVEEEPGGLEITIDPAEAAQEITIETDEPVTITVSPDTEVEPEEAEEEPEVEEEPEEPEVEEEPEEEPEEEVEAPEDGWYTEEQAGRGEEAYDQHCAHCHGDDLEGMAGNPPLVGETFLARWDTVWDLFDYTRETMPLDAPGTLDDETYADITAYMLQENDFPAGEAELPAEQDELEEMALDPDAVEDEDDENEEEEEEAG